jgi:hypothetical protein
VAINPYHMSETLTKSQDVALFLSASRPLGLRALKFSMQCKASQSKVEVLTSLEPYVSPKAQSCGFTSCRQTEVRRVQLRYRWRKKNANQQFAVTRW